MRPVSPKSEDPSDLNQSSRLCTETPLDSHVKEELADSREILEYKKLRQNLNCGVVQPSRISNIVRTIFFSRARFSSIFSYPLLMLISYLRDCRCLQRRISSDNRRKIKIFENGQRKFFRELDVVNLLQSVRVSKFVANNILTGRQKTLL